MKKIILLVLFLLFKVAFAQNSINENNTNSSGSTEEDDYILNLTTGASTPGFSVLGLSPSSVDRPKDPTDFAILVQNATENFNTIPKNYAIEFSSAFFQSLFQGKNKTGINKFNETKDLINNVIQSLTFSIATSQTKLNDIDNPRIGVGIKFSLLRGSQYNSFLTKKETENAEILKEVHDNLKKGNQLEVKIRSYIYSSDSKLMGYSEELSKENLKAIKDIPKIRELNAKITARQIELNNSLNTPEIAEKLLKEYKDIQNKIRKLVNEDIKFIRDGIKLDFAGALAYDYPEQKYDKGKLSKKSFWGILGWDWNVSKDGANSIFGVFRYSESPLLKDTLKKDDGTIILRNGVIYRDFGIRGIIDLNKFYLSGELITRSESEKNFQTKYLLDFGYNMGSNKLIVLSFGKEFDGEPYKKGTLVTAINLILGFGAKRNLF